MLNIVTQTTRALVQGSVRTGQRAAACCARGSIAQKSSTVGIRALRARPNRLRDSAWIRDYSKASMQSQPLVSETFRKTFTAETRIYEFGPHELERFSEDLQNDYNLVYAAVTLDGMTIQYASEELRENEEIIRAALHNNGLALKYLSDEQKADPDIVLIAVKNNYSALQFADPKLCADKTFIKKAVRCHPYAFKFASQELRTGRDFIIEMLTGYPYKYQVTIYDSAAGAYSKDAYNENVKRILECVDPKFFSDRELLLKGRGLVSIFPLLDLKLRNDVGFVQEFLSTEENFLGSLEHIGPEVKANKEFIISRINPYVPESTRYQMIKHADPSLWDDAEVMAHVLGRCRQASELVGKKLKNSPSFYVKLFSELVLPQHMRKAPDWRDSFLTIYTLPNYLLDKDFAVELFKSCGDAVRGDIKAALLAVKISGYALEHVNDDLKKNWRVVQAAIDNEPGAIKFVDTNAIQFVR